MNLRSTKNKLIVIVGPTASGKSALAVTLAKTINGEVISADSRQVYSGLDLGSGKITNLEMSGVPHHLLDVADLSTTYTATNFVNDAKVAINRIVARGKTPIITGGTFFYIDLLLGKIQNSPVPPNPSLRKELEKLSTAELYERLQQGDPERAQSVDPSNRHRLIRSLEIVKVLGKVPKLPAGKSTYEVYTIGIKVDKSTLVKNIKQRLEQRLTLGMVEEVEQLLKSGIPKERLTGFGLEYRYLTEFLNKEITEVQMKELIQTKSWQYAKRQYTWLNKQPDIKWYPYPIDQELVNREVQDFLKLRDN